MKTQLTYPNHLFEVSWEVCNKVGGIHTVITSKALTLVRELEDRLIMIGPDVWKQTAEHPEFKEDPTLLISWKNHASGCGFKVRIGRWKIVGNPIVILIDFTPFFKNKDEIFRDLWQHYKVDSLTSNWEYIEPALFGYAAGKVIESFYHYHLALSDKIVAQFHEWLTGGGLLYLNENVPQIGTVFTTHATVIGRTIAGLGLPLYSKFESYNGNKEAHTFNCVSKHSLEKQAAANSDCFTTVSETTERECIHFLGKKPDMITPNGFEDFIVPDVFFYKEKRALARKKLLSVAQALIGYSLPEDTLLLIKSGRYEFHNKGIDIFIDALGELNSQNLKKEIVAFLFVPAHCTGPRKDLLERMELGNYKDGIDGKILTHYLQGTEKDLIFNRIQKNALDNEKDKMVKVVFVPEYVNGQDGIFNLDYYDLLIGFDLSAFPSYYEPWGYTPLESLAFHIPTIITNLTGFAKMMKKEAKNIGEGLAIIERNDNNDKEAAQQIAAIINEFAKKTDNEISSAREAAVKLSKSALWKNFIEFYKKAYGIALEKVNARSHLFVHEAKVLPIKIEHDIETMHLATPVWRKIFVQFQLPEKLEALNKLAKNLWWTWNREAEELFELMDKKLWDEVEHNPVLLLDKLTDTHLKKLEINESFIAKLQAVNTIFKQYMGRGNEDSPLVAYFCMEYGICNHLKLYSGGLGILAGDYLKEASDKGSNMIALGLLYRNGYFKQEISMKNDQISKKDVQEFTLLPLLPVYDHENNWLKIGIALPGRTLYAKVWKVEVGRIPLYLLDTDISENIVEDRSITDSLYGGDMENRLRQELLLGIGGVRLLKILNINPDVYHYNEGHAAFAGLERLLTLVQGENITFDEALEIVKSSSLFTTHTPVPAGHDRFSEDLLRIYLSYHSEVLNINWTRLMALGRMNENDSKENFSMSVLAARLSQEINAVSAIHQKVSRKMFNPIWKGYAEEEINIGHVTNGVHYATWTAPEWQLLHKNTFGKEFAQNISDTSQWKKIYDVPDQNIWDIRMKYKNELIQEIKKRVKRESEERYEKLNTLTEKTLIIGFARRFATYKRSHLLFYNLNKLSNIITKSTTPVLFLFAGKAHPNDLEGQALIKRILEISKNAPFQSHIIFLSGYDITLAKILTCGVDVWLNTPEYEKEASGTSGMKAALNGVLNCSVPDGWWGEAFIPDAGWVLPVAQNNGDVQKTDADTLYRVLENEIIPLYSERNEQGLPEKWILKIKNSLVQIAPHYTTHRMLKEYEGNYYTKLNADNKTMTANHFKKAKDLVSWKHKITEHWQNIKVVTAELYDSSNKPFPLGAHLQPKLILELGEISVSDIDVEIIFIDKRTNNGDFNKIIFKSELLPLETKDKQITFASKIPITQSGVYEYGFRICPKSPLLAYKQNFLLLKWI